MCRFRRLLGCCLSSGICDTKCLALGELLFVFLFSAHFFDIVNAGRTYIFPFTSFAIPYSPYSQPCAPPLLSSNSAHQMDPATHSTHWRFNVPFEDWSKLPFHVAPMYQSVDKRLHGLLNPRWAKQLPSLLTFITFRVAFFYDIVFMIHLLLSVGFLPHPPSAACPIPRVS